MRRNTIALSVAVVVAAASFTACSSDGGSSAKSPQEAVCSDASALKSSVSKLVGDVTSGNFGDADDQISTITSDIKALETSVRALGKARRSDVKSDVDAFKATLADVTKASSPQAVMNQLGSARQQLEKTVDTITNTLKC